MNNNDRRAIAIVLAGVVIIGSMVPNYFNIAAFFAHSVPAWIWWMAWLSALVYDAAWLYGSWAHITGGGGRATRVMLIGGVVCAVGINVRQAWLVASATGVGWTIDALAGHALLPVAGLLAVHGLAHYLKTIPADAPEVPDAETGREFSDAFAWLANGRPLPAQPDPLPPVVTPPKPAPKARKAAPAVPAVLAAKATVQATGKLPDGFSTQAALAKHLGIDPARVSEWKREIANGASANGAAGAAGTGAG